MADEIKTTSAENNSANETVLTTEQLMAQIEQLTADRDRYKSANDKLSKSEAEIKRQLKAKLSEEERISAEQAEAQRLREEEFEAIKAENNRMKALSAYKSISNDKVVESLIEAVSNADHSAISLIIENEKKLAIKEAQTEWLKSRPQASIGGNSAMTKEDIMAIADRNERMRAIALNQNLFN